ncbi:MAG: D-aminoacylase, partial [Acidobacteria bacterium]|nr:D-aminoacylase [Acidobacteriota bacterium]
MLRILALISIFAFAAAGQQRFDILIKGGTVIDGTGDPGYKADVGLLDGRISRIGDLSLAKADRVIDAKGLVVAPGFVDMHNHSDQTLLDEPKCESMIRQGVTTMALGEGGSMGPTREKGLAWTTLGGYFDYVDKQGVAANITSYVGQTQIWTYVKGEALEPATDADIEAMKAEVARAMQEGAMGLSTSLLMPPSSLITTEQLVELAKVASSYGGIYSTHIRDEGAGVFRSIEEAINVGKGAKIRVDIIHMKIADQEFWGQMKEVIAMIDRARREGYDIRAHVYPYTAGQNNLRAIIPPWAHDGGNEKMLERLRDPEMRKRMKKDILNGLPGWYNHYLAVGGDWSRMLLVSLKDPKNKPFVGKRMSELIAARGGDPVEVLFDVLLEENGSVSTVYFHHEESDMLYALKQPYTSVGSDGAAISPEGPSGGNNPHPRWYGTFPRVLGRYVREQKALTLEEAVRKITSMNAEKINIFDRGYLREGYRADVTLFNPDTVIDKATFENPHQYPEGIPYVIVNGKLVLDNGTHTGELPGVVIRG